MGFSCFSFWFSFFFFFSVCFPPPLPKGGTDWLFFIFDVAG